MKKTNARVRTALPPWFKQKIPTGGQTDKVTRILDSLKINTVCESAQCPNRTACYGRGTATFMILGNICTRNCTFCAVRKGAPKPPDAGEPARISEAVKSMGVQYSVITSVTRDDIPDEGAGHFAETVKAVKENNPCVLAEILIPDIIESGKMLESDPDVIGHNLETVPRFYPNLRPEANYRKSLEVLFNIKRLSPNTLTKSGIMLGLGETKKETEQTMDDLLEVGCDIITMGQYLRPSERHFPVKAFVRPEKFEELKETALAKGFKAAAAAPLVRSSYTAHEIFLEASNGGL